MIVRRLSTPNQNTYVEMNNVIAKGKGEILCVDYLSPLPKAMRGLKHLIFGVDAFTKLVKFYAVTRPTARVVLNVILNKYISWRMDMSRGYYVTMENNFQINCGPIH